MRENVFVLSLFDLAIWLGSTFTILLVTSEFVRSYTGESPISIDKDHLYIATVVVGICFFIVVLIHVVNILSTI